jgi:hypothetical protein
MGNNDFNTYPYPCGYHDSQMIFFICNTEIHHPFSFPLQFLYQIMRQFTVNPLVKLKQKQRIATRNHARSISFLSNGNWNFRKFRRILKLIIQFDYDI